MVKFTKFNSQVPEAVRDRFMQEEHGHKQLACTSGLIWYFNANEETKRLYRVWAQAIAEGYATIEQPPDMVKAALEKRSLRPPPRRKKGRR